MKTTGRSSLSFVACVAGAALLHICLLSASTHAQTSSTVAVSTAEDLYIAVYDSLAVPNDSTIVLGNTINVALYDGDLRFIDRKLNIRSQGNRIENSASSERFYFKLEYGSELAFLDNAVLSGGNGSLFYLDGDNKLTFTNNATLSNNTGAQGGTLFASSDDGITILDFGGNLTISHSTADQQGGAIYIQGYEKDSVAVMVQSTVAGNAVFSTNASVDGGALYANMGELLFSGTLTVSHNIAETNGGGFSLVRSNMNVGSTASFSHNKTTYDSGGGTGGGAVFAANSTIDFRNNATFQSNISAQDGGAIYSTQGSTIRFFGTADFQSNQALEGDGGAIMINSGMLTFDSKTNFIDNSAVQGSGGALHIKDTGDSPLVRFKGETTFSGNTALTGQGGAIYVYHNAGLASTANAVFSTNRALLGGALYTVNSTVALLGNTTSFSGNVAGLTGGAIDAADRSNLTFGNTSGFTGNQAAIGGAVSAKEDSQLTFVNVVFSTNSASLDGGALHLHASRIDIDGSATFRSNTSMNNGGAAFIDGGGNMDYNGLYAKKSVTLSDNVTSGSGGGFYLTGASAQLGDAGQSILIERNKAGGAGGAFHLTSGSTIKIGAVGSTTSIIGNTASTSNGKGGAFHVDDLSSVTLGGTVTISGNSANQGGAFYLDNGTIEVTSGSNVMISGNQAASSQKSGAIYVTGDTGSALVVASTSSKPTTLIFEAGNSVADNAIYIDRTYFTLDTDAHAGIVVHSQLAGDTTATLVKTGAGYVALEGNTSQFLGNIIVTDGQLILGQATRIGSTAANVLSVSGSGQLIVVLDDQPATAKVRVDSLALTSSTTSVLVRAATDSTAKFALLTVNDTAIDWSDLTSSTGEIAFDPLFDFLRVKEWTWSTSASTSTLYVQYELDPNQIFNLPNTYDTFTIQQSTLLSSKALTVNGLGTLILASTQSQVVNGLNGSGNITLDPHTQLTVGGTRGIDTATTNGYTGTIHVDGTATLVFDQTEKPDGYSSDYRSDFSGTLEGSGKLLIQGKVRTTVAGKPDVDKVYFTSTTHQSYSGTVDIHSSWLVLEKSDLRNATINVVSTNSAFGGYGTVSTVVVGSGGALQANGGNLDVKGTLKFNGDGYLYINLDIEDGKNNYYITADTLLADGAGGVHIEVAYIRGTVEAGKPYTILSANHEISSTIFSSAPIEYNGATFNYVLSSDAGKYYVNLVSSTTIRPPSPPAPVTPDKSLPHNLGQTAWLLDTISGNYSSTVLDPTIRELNKHKTVSETETVYDDTYRNIVYQLAGAVRANGLQLGMYSPGRTIFNRLAIGNELYGGAPIIYNGGYGPVSRNESEESDVVRGQSGTHGHDICYMTGENRFWFDAIHLQTSTKSDKNSTEYGISRTGFLLGYDIQRSMTGRFGLYGGYFTPYLWQGGDRVEAEDYHTGLFLQQNHRGVEFYAFGGYAHQDYRMRRFIDLSALNLPDHRWPEQYKGKTKGDSYSFSLEVTRPQHFGNYYIVKPYVGVDYLGASQKGFTETGGLYALRYDGARYEQWVARMGVKVKRETPLYSILLRAQYANQFDGNAYPDSAARFATVRTAEEMTIRGVDLGRNFVTLGSGLNFYLNSAQSRVLTADYELNAGKKSTSHGIQVIYIERF